MEILSRLLRSLGSVLPGVTTSLLERLFLGVRRHGRPSREDGWLVGARRHTVVSGSHQLAVWSWGEGPVVLLAHGWEGRGAQLGAIVRPLVARGFRVVAWDAPGHGESTGRRSSIVEMRDAVLTVAGWCGPVWGVVAHSAGAAAVSLAYHQGLDASRFVYVSPTRDPGAFLARLVETLGLPDLFAELTQGRIERRFAIRWSDLGRLASAPALDRPLLVVHDRLDREVPWSEGRDLAAAWPLGRLVSTEGLGHRRILRDDGVVAEVVAELARPAAFAGLGVGQALAHSA